MNHRYKITVAYDGTDYAGWQVQPGQITVQGEIERAIEKMTGKSIRIYHSGRTDAGVHAKGQVAHFDLEDLVAPDRFIKGLNAHLGGDIRILNMGEVRPDFNARHDAISKEYRYLVWNGLSVPPELRRYRLHERRKLDIRAMRQAAKLLVGRHDFSAFTTNPQRDIKSTVKTVTHLTIHRTPEGDVTISVVGEGFLYKMVRSIVGFLLRVGRGELTPEDTQPFLNTGVRTHQVPTVKPLGLFLWRVDY